MENSTINYLIISEEVSEFFKIKNIKIYDNCPTYFKFYSLCKKHFYRIDFDTSVYKNVIEIFGQQIFGYGYVEREHKFEIKIQNKNGKFFTFFRNCYFIEETDRLIYRMKFL